MENSLAQNQNKRELKNQLETLIETKRLILKPLELEYAKQIFPEFNSEITTFMSPSAAQDISETQHFIEDAREKMRVGTDIFSSIFDKSTGEFLGGGGLHNLDTATPELGIWIKKSAHGQKFGKEAVAGLKEWADKNIAYE